MYLPGSTDWKSLLEKDPLLAHAFIPGSLLMLVVAALLAPDDILAQWSVLSVPAGWVSGLVPSVSQWAAVSDFPQVTELFFALGWALAPIQLLAAYRMPGLHLRLVTHWRQSRAVRLTLPIAIFVILPALVWAAVSVGWESRDCVGVCLGKSRASLALVGPFIPMASAFAVVVILVWFRRFKEIYFAA